MFAFMFSGVHLQIFLDLCPDKPIVSWKYI